MMIIKRSLTFLLLGLFVHFQNQVFSEDFEKGNCNEVFQGILDFALDIVKEMEPINITGKDVAPCSYCEISGIHTLQRYKDITTGELNDMKNVDASISIGTIVAKCYQCKLLLAKQNVEAKIKNMAIRLNASFDMFEPERNVVHDVKVVKDGKWDAKVKGKGLLGITQSLLLNLLKPIILLIAKGAFKDGMPKMIDSLKGSLESLFAAC